MIHVSVGKDYKADRGTNSQKVLVRKKDRERSD